MHGDGILVRPVDGNMNPSFFFLVENLFALHCRLPCGLSPLTSDLIFQGVRVKLVDSVCRTQGSLATAWLER